MNKMLRAILLVAISAICCGTVYGQVTLNINKSNNAPSPVQSAVPFTYTIGYSWSGGIPSGGTLIIQDVLPASLDAIAPYTNYPGNTTFASGTNTVTYTQTGISSTAGSGVLQVYVQFKQGVTCDGTVACDTARIQEPQGKWTVSNSSCAKAKASNNWTFENELYAGCAACPGNDVIFRVKIMNPSAQVGGLNMTNVTLNYSFPLASGAVISDVTLGPSSPSVTPCPTYSYSWCRSATGSNAITVNLDPATYLSLWNYWVTLYVHVNFPCNQVGNTFISTASLSYKTPCDTIKPLTFSDTAKVTLCAAIQTGNLYKDFLVPTYNPYNPYFFPGTITPNCCGTYRIFYSNTGTVGQSGVIVTDTVPGSMDVSQIYTDVPSGMGPVKVEAWKYPSGPWTVIQLARTVPGTDPMPVAPMPVGKIRWTYSGVMPVATSLYNTIDVCVRTVNFKTGVSVIAGQNIIDTVVVTNAGGLSYTAYNNLTVSQIAPKLIAEKAFIGTCDGTGAHPGGPWFPGDTVRFRIAVANLGSAAALPVTITDLLPAGFSYQGHETYYYGTITPAGWWLSPYSPACLAWPPTNPVPTQVGGSITSPAIGTANPSNCVWTFPTLPSRCDGTPEYFIIEFDVKITNTPVPTLPGTYANNFTIAATNATSATSNNAYVVVSSRPSVAARKEVRRTPGGTFGPSATIAPGGTGEYRLTVKNTGNVPLSNVCLLDILPHTSDIGVLPPYAVRGSAFNIIAAPGITVTPAVGFATSYFSNSSPPNPTGTVNPSRILTCGGFCISSDPPGAITTGSYVAGLPVGGTYSFKVSATSASVTLAPGATLQVIVPFTVPANAKVGDIACNSFAYQCTPTGSTTCLAAEPIDVCITVQKDSGIGSGPCCPCDTLSVAPTNIYGNIQTQWKTITIYNLHCSPIDSINLRYYDCSTGTLIPQINLAALNGGNLHVYRNPSTNVTLPYSAFNASNRYQHMPLPINTTMPVYGTPPTQDRVSFDLGLNYFLVPASWCLHVIIYHANGDSCVDTLPRWAPEPPANGTGLGTATTNGTITGVALTVDPKRFQTGTIGFLSATVVDTNDIIVGGSGTIWESQVDSANLPRPRGFVQSKRNALFTLLPDSMSAKAPYKIYVFVAHAGDQSKKPSIKVGLYDTQANLISTDSVVVSTTVSKVDPMPGVMVPSNDLAIKSVRPNPARNTIDVQYYLGAQEEATLELVNTLGQTVGVIAQGSQSQGEHVAHYIVSALPEGSYYVRLSTQFGQTTTTVKIVR
jgi:uncharacterized repeat protein (TIGR01451 family)